MSKVYSKTKKVRKQFTASEIISQSIQSTAKNMREYGFSLTRFLPYKDRNVDSELIRENTGQ